MIQLVGFDKVFYSKIRNRSWASGGTYWWLLKCNFFFFLFCLHFSPHEAVTVQFCLSLFHTHTNTQVHRAQIERQGQRRHSVFTEHTPAVRTKAAGWQMRCVSGGGGAMCCYCCAGCVFVCACSVLCLCICACMHVSACLCTYMCVCLHVCVYMCVYFAGGGWSHGAALCLSHLPPHSTDTQGNGKKGWGIHFGKKESGSSGLMGNNAGFTDGPEAKDTGWVCGSQSTNLFDKTAGHPCQNLPRPA